jgi:hypothetical protein
MARRLCGLRHPAGTHLVEDAADVGKGVDLIVMGARQDRRSASGLLALQRQASETSAANGRQLEVRQDQ